MNRSIATRQPAWRRIFLRPSLWVAVISVVVYWDDTAMHGSFAYDDAGSIKNNVVVNGQIASNGDMVWWKEIWKRDFWGTPMVQPQSHKSFRPLTTLTFRWNWMLSEWRGTNGTSAHTYGFHVANVCLHGVVSGLVTEAAGHVFRTSPCDYDVSMACIYDYYNLYHDTSDLSNGNTLVSSNSEALNVHSNDNFENAILAQIITGLVFGLHPVHAEAVSNITSRGELLMSLFFLVAFISYARHVEFIYYPHWRLLASNSGLRRWRSLAGIYFVPWFCMTVSLFCKEQGATTLITLVVYDFLHYHRSLREFVWQSHWIDAIYRTQQIHDGKNHKRSNALSTVTASRRYHSASVAVSFIRRTTVLALQTVLVCLWRYWLNGETSPDFIYDQNPAGFSKDRFTRMFSVSWIYCLYIADALLPLYLAPDWSGKSIPLIERKEDPRTVIVLVLWLVSAYGLVSLLMGMRVRAQQRSIKISTNTSTFTTATMETMGTQQAAMVRSPSASHRIRRIALQAFFAFLLSPFLLSSNLLVVVGLMKADRVIYLPLMGFCIMQALLMEQLFLTTARREIGTINSNHASVDVATENLDKAGNLETFARTRSDRPRATRRQQLGHLLLLLQMLWYARKLHERNIAWSHSLNLWIAAFLVNPISHHTRYNCGYELSLKQRYLEAEYVMRPIAHPRVDGPSNTFVYAMVLYNLERCQESHALIDEAMKVIEEKRQNNGDFRRLRDSDSALNRVKSNLLVARSFCTSDLPRAGQILYDAVQTDPTNGYAIEQATALLNRIEQAKKLMAGRSGHGV